MYNCRNLSIGIIAAALVNVVVGFLWYSPLLFGNLYQQYMGMAGMPAPEMQAIIAATIGSFLAALVIAAGMCCFMHRLRIVDLKGSFNFGWLSWLTFVAPVTLQGVLYAKWPMVLYCINNGYNLAAFVSMAVVLSYFVKRSF
jgi:hypothetical protein